MNGEFIVGVINFCEIQLREIMKGLSLWMPSLKNSFGKVFERSLKWTGVAIGEPPHKYSFLKKNQGAGNTLIAWGVISLGGSFPYGILRILATFMQSKKLVASI